MTLSDRIVEDMKQAMKGGNRVKLETLRTVRAQFIELSKRGQGSAITVEEELAVLLGAIKKRKEAIDLYQQAGRKELVDQESAELAILQSYLPRQLSRGEAEAIIKKAILETGASSPKDFGKVMGLAMKELKGKIDGGVVQGIVKQLLGSP